MAVTHRTTINFKLVDQTTFSAPFSGGPSAPLAVFAALSDSDADQIYRATLSLIKNDNADLDLFGTLLQADNLTKVDIDLVKFIAIQNNGPGALSITEESTNGVANLFTGADQGQKLIGAGSLWFWYDPEGLTVTDTTGDLITVTELNVDAITYEVFLGGPSA